MSSFNQSSNNNNNNNNSKLNNLHTIVDELATGLKTKLGGLLSELLNRSDDLDETNRIILTLPVVKNALSSTFARIEQSILESNHETLPFQNEMTTIHHLQSDVDQTCTFNYNSLINHVPPLDLDLEQVILPVAEDNDKQEALVEYEDEEAAEDQVAIEDEEVLQDVQDVQDVEEEEDEEVIEEPVNISLKIEEIEEESPDDAEESDEDEVEEADEEVVVQDEVADEEAEEDEDEGDEVEEDEHEGDEGDEVVEDEEAEDEVVEVVEDEEAEAEEEAVADAEESDEEVVEEEEEVKTDDDVVEEDEDEGEEDEEVFEIDIMGKTYFTNNATSGDIYEMDSAGDPGEEVGKFVKGVAKFN